MVEKMNAQQWLEANFKEKNGVIEINFLWKESGKKTEEATEKLEGEILIKDYLELKEIDFSGAKGVTKLTIENCPNVEVIDLYGNPITEVLGSGGLIKLRKLNYGDTNIAAIDVSKNTGLREIFLNDKQEIKIVGFINIVKQLNVWSSIDGIAFPWEQIAEKDLKEIAKELGIKEGDLEGKSPEELRKVVKEKVDKFRGNEDKIKQIPGLINKEGEKEGEINDERLEELKKLEPGELGKLKKTNELLTNHIQKHSGRKEWEQLQARIEKIEIKQ